MKNFSLFLSLVVVVDVVTVVVIGALLVKGVQYSNNQWVDLKPSFSVSLSLQY